MNSQSKAKQRYNSKAYDRIEVKVRKGTKDIIRSHAESIGKSLNGYISELIMSDMERDKAELRAADTEPKTAEE